MDVAIDNIDKEEFFVGTSTKSGFAFRMMAATGRSVRRRRHDKSQYGHSRDPYLSLGLPMSGRNSGCLPFLVSGWALAPTIGSER